MDEEEKAGIFKKGKVEIRGMKSLLFSFLLLFAAASIAVADDAPFIMAHADQLDKRVAADVKAGTIAQGDADKFSAKISHVRTVVQTQTRLTPMTRKTMRKELDDIERDIANKETAGAAGAASPSATP